MLRTLLGPRSSMVERLTRFNMFCMADCGLGLRRIAALMRIGRIADCTLDTSQCKDPREGQTR
eukprot:4316046-Alexandrium_andersonii.AAC.1